MTLGEPEQTEFLHSCNNSVPRRKQSRDKLRIFNDNARYAASGWQTES
ncbi:hypothetical protein C8D95_106141 [Silicimonas algicola]|uniref:Uncharacterized protein n=1 Tax=Silicimonas algicola TaxID=1826607 RepID=A0A316G699_9RHOB|nr:hypothetical protein C8D95_106141 [Silicimonas algicola]